MTAYLDNSATTRVYPEVQELMVRLMDEDYGNPSSMHRKGLESEEYIKKAKQQIAAALKAETKDIIITSGGTESNNLALIGTALSYQRRGRHIITTAVEHASVKATASFLEEQGFTITYLPADSKGTVSLKALEEAITPETILVSMMYVNNEIGTVQPVEAAAELIHRISPDIIFHVDAIQAFGKFVIRPRKQGIDLMSVSGHKINGPKGVGFLYCNDRVRLHPIIFGGGQQKGMRSGTENVPGTAGLGLASEITYRDFQEKHERYNSLRRHFLEGIHRIEGAYVNGWDETVDTDECLDKRAPHIVSVSFEGVRSEVLLHVLEDSGVYVSSGSACSSNKPALSSTLQAIGLRRDLLDSTIRFSFGVYTTEEELDYALEVLNKQLPMLRRYYRR